MSKGFLYAHLACGCRLSFREGTGGSRFVVMLDHKAPGCTIPLHVQHAPLFDHREALRPPTRLGPAVAGEYEEEG